jgi:hypothetical protein
MIDLASTDFYIDVPALGEDRLKAYAGGLFESWEVWLDAGLPLADYAVRLEVSQGSFKGVGRVAAAVGVLYAGIANYGSFRSGVREIHHDVKRAGDFLSEHAVAPFSAQGRPEMRSRMGPGAVTQLENLFRRVERGQLDPNRTADAAIELFKNEPGVEPEFLRAIARAFRETVRAAQQVPLFEGTPDDNDATPPSRGRRPSAPEAPVPAVPRVEVAIWRETKRGLKQVKVLTN